MKKFLNKSQSFHTSSSYINKNKSYLTNKSSLITNAHTYKKITPQTSFLNLQTRNTSHYHDSLSSYLIPNPKIKNNTNTTNNYILKDSFRTSTLSKDKPIMLFKKRKIAFGRLVPRTNASTSVRKRIKVFSSLTNSNDIDTAISNNTTINTPQTNLIHHKQRSSTPNKVFSLFKHGLSQKEYNRIKNYNCSCDTITTQPKQSFPMISTKKVVKNILPKEYNYSKRKSPDEVMRNAYHPVVRFQKKQITKHTNNIYKEINVDYSNTFTLINKLKFSEKFRTAEDLIDLEKNTNLYALIDKIISSSFKLGNEIDNIIEQKRKENKEDKRKKLLLKFKRILIRAAIHFKRLGVSLEEFLTMDLNRVKPFEYKDSVDLIFAIKNKDKDSVCRLIKENKFIVFDFDNFRQTPCHWAAKRNMYEVISLMAYNGANVSAQDSIGRTPLHIAAQYNNIESIEILLYEIADPLIRDNHGLLPFDLTSDSVIQYMLQRAASLHKIRSGINYLAYINSIKSGLEFLFLDELKTNFEEIRMYIYKE